MRILARWHKYYQGKLGRRLLLAGLALIGLALFSGLVAVAASSLLGQRTRQIVDDSVPAVMESTALEQESARLRYLAAQLAKSDTLTDLATSQRQIEKPLTRISQAVAFLSGEYPRQAPELKRQIEVSRTQIEILAGLMQHNLTAQGDLRMARMRIEWLHDDLVDELQQLSDEQNRLMQQNRHAADSTFNTLLQLNTLEQDCAQALLTLARPRDQAIPSSAFERPGRCTSQLLQQARHLPPEQSGNLLQLLQTLAEQSRQDGELSKALARLIESQRAVQQLLAKLEIQLDQQNALAHRLSQQGRENAQRQFRQALSLSEQSRLLVSLATMASIAVTLWVLFGLIGHRVIARLGLLGRNIESLGQGHRPRHIGGRDEIGQLGQQLEQLADRIEETERTNALALINHTAAALLIATPQGRIRSINQAARLLCPQLDVDASLSAILPVTVQADLALLDDESGLDIILQHGAPEEEQFLRLLAHSFRQHDENVLMVTLLDVSAQMRSAHWLEKTVQEKTEALDQSNQTLREEIDERKRAQNSLVQATKFAVLGQTATSLAHELNQPLAAMTNYLYTAQMQNAQPAEQHSTLEQIGKVIERMSRLVRSYRMLGRTAPPTPQLQVLDLDQVLSDVIELLQGRIRKQGVVVQMPPQAPNVLVQGEVVRIEQILLNLLGNALDASGPAGQIRLAISREDGRTELYIADSGPGLSAGAAQALFQPFFTTKPEGLGLGLSICSKLAEDCHAEIRFACDLAGGALFILSLEPADAV